MKTSSSRCTCWVCTVSVNCNSNITKFTQSLDDCNCACMLLLINSSRDNENIYDWVLSNISLLYYLLCFEFSVEAFRLA
ncbi:hypothetical protein ACHWQZ_G000023 [Mnemiopsis leidyi]